MNPQEFQFKAIMQLLVPMVVEQIISRFSVRPDSALQELYASRLYSDLERESTALWHLSPLALAELWYEEKTTGCITYPEEQ